MSINITSPINCGQMSSNQVATTCPHADVDKVSKKSIAYIRSKLKAKYGKAKPKRIFHAKSVGLVKAVLTVANDLDPFLKEGLFKGTQLEYKAYIRFSVSGSTVGADNKKGFRGMAIKIIDIEGNDFLDHDSYGKTQDIILINSQNFVPGSAELALDGVKIILGNMVTRVANFLHVISISTTGIASFLKNVGTSPNVLEENYYSATPFAFGNKKAIKWHARPLKTITSVMPPQPTEDYLRQKLISDLAIVPKKERIAFDLYVQFQEDKKNEPIDDSSVIWKTAFYKVGTIYIPPQEFDTMENDKMDEDMTFSPGHAMVEHAPLGGVNAVRRKVYQHLANERLSQL